MHGVLVLQKNPRTCAWVLWPLKKYEKNFQTYYGTPRGPGSIPG